MGRLKTVWNVMMRVANTNRGVEGRIVPGSLGARAVGHEERRVSSYIMELDSAASISTMRI